MTTPQLLRYVSVLVLSIAILQGFADGPPLALAGSPSVLVPLSGTVSGVSDADSQVAEPVNLKGKARITSSPVLALDTGLDRPASILLTIDILNMNGKGAVTRKQYVTSGVDQVYRARTFVPADQIDVTFPFYPTGRDRHVVARAALASFTISFDSAGHIIAATGSLSNPAP